MKGFWKLWELKGVKLCHLVVKTLDCSAYLLPFPLCLDLASELQWSTHTKPLLDALSTIFFIGLFQA